MGKRRKESCGNRGEAFTGRADSKSADGDVREQRDPGVSVHTWTAGGKTKEDGEFSPYTLTTTVRRSVLSGALSRVEAMAGSPPDSDYSTRGQRKPESGE